MENINSKEYWNHRFENDWEQMQGKEQTSFFAQLALELMPQEILEEIKKDGLTICDFGCAEGQAVDLFYKKFGTDVCGVDFSESVIALAKKNYPSYIFIHKDFVNDSMEDLHADIGYISNVLEHLDHPWKAAVHAGHCVKKYLLVLIPFRETMQIAEHCNKFDTSDIPMKLDDFQLMATACKDCSKIPGTLYADDQILLVYKRMTGHKKTVFLHAIVETFERKYKEQLSEKEQEIVRLGLQNQDERDLNECLKKEIGRKKKEIESLKNRVCSCEKEIEHLKNDVDGSKCQLQDMKETNEELVQKCLIYEKDTDYMKNMIYEMQRERIQIYQSRSWRITAPLRKCLNIYRLMKSPKHILLKIRSMKLYHTVKGYIPEKWKKRIINKYFQTFDTDLPIQNTEQEAVVFALLEQFEQDIGETDQVILVFSGVKYIDSEGQRNIRLIHEARRMGKKIVFAYWRWDSQEAIEQPQDHMIQIPIDLLSRKKVTIFENFFRTVKEKCLLIEFPHPCAVQIIEIANSFGWKTIYDVIDDWEAFSRCGQADWYKRKAELRIANIVDANIATANLLKQKLEKELILEKPYYLITNGVDPKRMQRSSRLPAYDCAKGELQIGYFGHLTKAWFNWPLMIRLAGKHSNWTFHLIGYGADDKLKVPDNILLYGKKKPEELPKYAAYWDVAVIPFVDNELTRGVNPIKVFEYLQLRLPVVACYMPEIEHYPYVKVAYDEKTFEQMIIDSKDVEMDEQIVQAFVDLNTWEKKCLELMACIKTLHKAVPYDQFSFFKE